MLRLGELGIGSTDQFSNAVILLFHRVQLVKCLELTNRLLHLLVHPDKVLGAKNALDTLEMSRSQSIVRQSSRELPGHPIISEKVLGGVLSQCQLPDVLVKRFACKEVGNGELDGMT